MLVTIPRINCVYRKRVIVVPGEVSKLILILIAMNSLTILQLSSFYLLTMKAHDVWILLEYPLVFHDSESQ